MIDVVFISDLHLHPEEPAIQGRFNAFIDWARASVKQIYILGDFFNAWSGDDSINDWSRAIALQIRNLVDSGIAVFYMHGNRDFLLGIQFARLSGWIILPEPCLIQLGELSVLLVHGDRYCTLDTSHQRFRRLTRNKLFSLLFLRLPLALREKMVNKVRTLSQSNQTKTMAQMDIVPGAVINHLSSYSVEMLIHGHTHKPGLTLHNSKGAKLKRFVLSDWDDTPQLLCYDSTKGLYFTRMNV